MNATMMMSRLMMMRHLREQLVHHRVAHAARVATQRRALSAEGVELVEDDDVQRGVHAALLL